MIEVAFWSRLSNDTQVASLTGGRVYQLKLQQSPDYPAVRIQLVSEVQTYVLARDLTNFFRARVQVDAWADESSSDQYAAARGLGQAINDALDGQAFTEGDVEVSSVQLLDRTVEYELQELGLVRVRQDYAAVYRVAATSP